VDTPVWDVWKRGYPSLVSLSQNGV